jgi:outer membrane protein OmpA-like peptidoglycan-associated protein
MTRSRWLAAALLALPGLAAAQAPARCPASFEAGGPAFLTCTCAPEDIGAAAVWGSGPFAMGSAICPAARFAGAIGAEGGVVRLDALPDLAAYAAGSANGITTRELGAARGSFSVSSPNAPLAFADLAAPAAAPAAPVERVPEEPPLAELPAPAAPAAPAVAAAPAAPAAPPPVERIPEEPAVAELPAAPPAPVAPAAPVAAPRPILVPPPSIVVPPAPVAVPQPTLRTAGRLTLGVSFATGSAELDPASTTALARLRDEMRADPALRARIVGHTDNEGGSVTNQRLSERRAASVVAWLTREGIAASRLVAEGRGASQPVADNATAEGRARNRRVEALRLD